MCRKPHQEKMCKNPKVKFSQGQMGKNRVFQKKPVKPGKPEKCAENPTRKKCAKIPRSNISGMCGMLGMPRSNFPRSNISGMPRSNSQGQISQGQIFQECQVQIPKVKFPRSNISGMPRSNSQG